MLSSYTDLYTKPCAKCSRLVDARGAVPVVRRQAGKAEVKVKKEEGVEAKAGGNGEGGREWEALHFGCA